jgi:glycosyltransferase involved in cell wall biosynthesis
MNSLATIAHELTRLLADRYAFTVVAGTSGRDATREVSGIRYHALKSRLDRRLSEPWTRLTDRLQGRNRHKFYRETFYPFFARRAADLFHRAQCDTILIQQFPQWVPVLRRRNPNARIVVSAQAVTLVEEVGKLCEQLSQADAVIACSRYVLGRIEHQVPSLRGRGHVVYNGMNPGVYSVDPTIVRSERTLMYSGRITPDKGVHVLVDAFRLLCEKHPDLRLILAGDIDSKADPRLMPGTDPQHMTEILDLCNRDYQNELASRAGPAASRMTMTGPLRENELAQHYRRCTVYVQPSLCEDACPLVIFEAMACGAPVVGTRRGGIPEFIEPFKTGNLVTSGDAKELAHVLDELLSQPEQTRRMGDKAAAKAAEHYSWQRCAESLAEVFDLHQGK